MLACVSDLSNHISQKDAYAELMRLREAFPALFLDVYLYLGVHDLLARLEFTLSVRQFLLGLFRGRMPLDSNEVWAAIDREALT